MRGVINVRGSVVPVIDLRLKFGMSRTENTMDTRIVVMEIFMDGEVVVLGTLADSVNEVIDLDKGRIEPPPRIGMRWRTEFIKGIGKRDELFIILLDIDRVFSSDELALAEAAGSEFFPEADAAALPPSDAAAGKADADELPDDASCDEGQ